MESAAPELGRKAFLDVSECLVAALEARDRYTEGHSLRVADLSVEIAAALGMRGAQLEELHIASHLHDIGKIGIPDRILYKPGRLLPEEFDKIREHPEIGCRILSRSASLLGVARIVLCHHERWDGGGYPRGLRGEEIPVASRIIAAADTLDAMTSSRPYRAARSPGEAMEEIRCCAGRQLDPAVARAACALYRSGRLTAHPAFRRSSIPADALLRGG